MSYVVSSTPRRCSYLSQQKKEKLSQASLSSWQQPGRRASNEIIQSRRTCSQNPLLLTEHITPTGSFGVAARLQGFVNSLKLTVPGVSLPGAGAGMFSGHKGHSLQGLEPVARIQIKWQEGGNPPGVAQGLSVNR